MDKYDDLLHNNDATEKLLSVAGSASVEEITQLVMEGADVTVKDKDGKTELDYADGKEYLKGTDAYNLLRERTLCEE